MGILGGLIIASCALMAGVILGGLLAGGKMSDLQDQIDCKRANWCGECRFKLDAAAFDETLLHERRSKYASLREKEKELNVFRRDLYTAKQEIDELKNKLQNVIRQMGIKHLSQQVARG